MKLLRLIVAVIIYIASLPFFALCVLFGDAYATLSQLSKFILKDE